MSTSWCNQLNEGLKKWATEEIFLWQKFFGNVWIYDTGVLRINQWTGFNNK